jgi:hypothetical protein
MVYIFKWLLHDKNKKADVFFSHHLWWHNSDDNYSYDEWYGKHDDINDDNDEKYDTQRMTMTWYWNQDDNQKIICSDDNIWDDECKEDMNMKNDLWHDFMKNGLWHYYEKQFVTWW